MTTNKNRWRKGSILVKAPFLLILFLGFTALAVDTGFVHLKRAMVQTAAESVAFSAAYKASASFLPTYDGVNLDGAAAYAAPLAQANAPGCQPPQFEWGNWSRALGFYVSTTSHLRNAVRVTVRMRTPRFFSALALRRDPEVVGRATVVFLPYGDVWPLAVSSTTTMNAGGILYFGADSANNAPGNKGWLSFNGDVNSTVLRVYLDAGPYTSAIPSAWYSTSGFYQIPGPDGTLANGILGTDVDIYGTTGLKTTLYANAQAQIAAGAIVMIPIWDTVQGNGSNAYYTVAGVVPIQLVPGTEGDGLSHIQGVIASDGPIWFVPGELPIETVRKRFKPYQNLTLVE